MNGARCKGDMNMKIDELLTAHPYFFEKEDYPGDAVSYRFRDNDQILSIILFKSPKERREFPIALDSWRDQITGKYPEWLMTLYEKANQLYFEDKKLKSLINPGKNRSLRNITLVNARVYGDTRLDQILNETLEVKNDYFALTFPSIYQEYANAIIRDLKKEEYNFHYTNEKEHQFIVPINTRKEL